MSTAVANPDNLAAFAAVRSSDGALTVMVVNKALAGATPVTLNLANFTAAGVVQAWQLSSANAIIRLADLGAGAAGISTTVPPQSITLFVIAAGLPPPIPAPSSLSFAVTSGGVVKLDWSDNSIGEQGFYIERAPAGSSGFVRVGQVSAEITSFSQAVPKGRYVYRVQAFNNTTGQASTYSNPVSVRVGGAAFVPLLMLLLLS